MGMNVGGSQGGVRSEINITPLVDVVLVLLIIFLVTMPILMKRVTLEVPRKITDIEEAPTGKTITVLIKADMSVVVNDGTKDVSIQATDLATTLKPLLDEKKTEKIIFVDFEDPVAWGETVSMMDTIRSLATDSNHDEVKVALKLRENAPAPATP